MDKWHEYFLKEAKLISELSKDPSTQTGAVIVRPDRTIAAKGYNGFPMGFPDHPRLYADRETKYRLIIHCEMNALLSARERVDGYTLYTWPILSCNRCAVHMVQAGITTVVGPKCPDHMHDRWYEEIQKSKDIFANTGIKVIEL